MEKEKSSIKTVSVIIIVLLLLFFFVFIFINRDQLQTNSKSEKEYDLVLIADDVIFQKTNNHWNKVTYDNNIRKLVNWKSYKIYTDYKYFGEYNLVKTTNWLAFDDDRNPIDMDTGVSSFFAYSSNNNFEVKELEIMHNDDLEKVKEILKEYKIDINYEPVINVYTKVDLDNDGINETIYAISNMLQEIETEPSFTIFLVERNNKLYRLFRVAEDTNLTKLCYPRINAVFDIDNDNENEIIMSCTTTGIESVVTALYKYNSEKDDYEIVISD